MKKFRTPLPDFANSFTHSCNNLASYEVKKNPDPSKKTLTRGSQLAKQSLARSGSTNMCMVKSKVVFQEKKDHG